MGVSSRRGWAAAGILLWAVSSLAQPGAPVAEPGTPAGVGPGTPIVAVRIVRHDVFDLDDPETSQSVF